MITSTVPTGVDMGQTHDDWHEWRHGTDQRLDGIDGRLDRIEHRLDGIDARLDRIDHELRIIRWLVGFMLATQVAIIGFVLVLAQMVLSMR